MERKGGCDEKLFRQAFNDNREMLERLAYFSVRDREAARDIVSNVFLKLWEMRESIDGDRLNYVTTTSDGKILRSSSMYIRNSEGKVIGSLCINLDITESIQFESFLKQYNKFELNDQPEYFATNVESLLDYLIQQATALTNKDPKELTKSERLDFLSFLDEKGAMQISKSGDRICKVLGISKFTLYNDLEIIRSKLEANAQ